MSKTIYLFIASGLIILLGTFVMYGVESQVPNSKIKTILDALWWCVATVTTVGYGDIVPISNIGRIVALFYMFFGISMLAILMSVITNTFYKRRFEKEEREKREEQLNYLKNQLMERLSAIEQKQAKCIDLINHLR
ncbi:MAG TPA: potassium channel family protein [Nitrososphaeraceae archaeon]|jgi:voltage-gated potassium channel|nr:potassium channel family protein [Nitrososphaeraceae archaeon]